MVRDLWVVLANGVIRERAALPMSFLRKTWHRDRGALHLSRVKGEQVSPRLPLPPATLHCQTLVTFDGAIMAWYTCGASQQCSGSNCSRFHRRALAHRYHGKWIDMGTPLPAFIVTTRAAGAAIDAIPAAEGLIKDAWRNPRQAIDDHVGIS